MAGYSGTPLARKLGLEPGHRLAWLGDRDRPAPPEELPEGAACSLALRGTRPFDVLVFFTKRRSELERRLPALIERLEESGGLWLSWPKKSSGVATDLSDGVVRELGLATGLVDNKVCAVDETWSGLRFVVRVANRASRKPSPRRR